MNVCVCAKEREREILHVLLAMTLNLLLTGIYNHGRYVLHFLDYQKQ